MKLRIEYPARCGHAMFAGDELLVLAEDDNTYTAAAEPAHARPGTCPAWKYSSRPERLLLVGWCVAFGCVKTACLPECRERTTCVTAEHLDGRRRDLDDLITALDEFAPPGSEVHLLSDVPIEDREALLSEGGLNIENLQVWFDSDNCVSDALMSVSLLQGACVTVNSGGA